MCNAAAGGFAWTVLVSAKLLQVDSTKRHDHPYVRVAAKDDMSCHENSSSGFLPGPVTILSPHSIKHAHP